MSLLFVDKFRKGQMVDMVYSVVQFLTFHALKSADHLKIAEHFARLPLLDDLDVNCKLTVDTKNVTTVTIQIIPRAK